ncbi:MAG TPA: hypothetical protein V6D14_25265 [Coleofasciculaceae cyanobacterium]|jgi:hypothetical protein
MDIKTQSASTLQNFQEAHREDIEAIARTKNDNYSSDRTLVLYCGSLDLSEILY